MIFQSSSNVYRDFYRKKKRKKLILEMHFKLLNGLTETLFMFQVAG